MGLGLLLVLGALEAPAADAGIKEPLPEAVIADAGLEAPKWVAPVPPPAVAPPAPAETASVAIWVQPLGTVAYGAGSAAQRTLNQGGGAGSPLLIYLAAGGSVLLPHAELAIELTFTLQAFGFASARAGVWTAVGPLFHLGGAPLNGFFLEPKVIGHYAFSVGDQNFNPPLDRWLVGLGLDVGYQFTFRHAYVALVLGAGVAAGNFPDGVATPVSSQFQFSPDGVFPTALFNLNLIRVGGWR